MYRTALLLPPPWPRRDKDERTNPNSTPNHHLPISPFVALAAYITVESIRALTGAAEADHSPVGIGLAALSLLVMPVLSYAQRRAGREYGSASAVADSQQTLLCTYLSAVLLIGLVPTPRSAGGGPTRSPR